MNGQNRFRGLKQIFSFTLRMHLRAKGYIVITVVGVLLCLLIPLIAMPAVEATGGADTETDGVCRADTVYVVDETGGAADYSVLSAAEDAFSAIRYQTANNLDEAADLARQNPQSLVLRVTQQDGYALDVLLPENSILSETDADVYAAFVQRQSSCITLQKAELNETEAAALAVPIEINLPHADAAPAADGEAAEAESAVRTVLSYTLPYATIFLLYFLILFYGQSIANSVIAEKNSKLMDTFLLSVDPSAMVIGKMSAIILSCLLQLFLWIAALVAGFAGGTFFVRLINPDTDMGLIAFWETLGNVSGMFTLPEILLTVGTVIAGFILYCSLAALGGALAEKPEDLSSTNMLFSMALVISFLCTIYDGGMEGVDAQSAWLAWIPFTAVLSVPGKLLLGAMPLWQGAGSLALTVLTALLIAYAAGRVYKAMIFYRGNPPKPAQLRQILKKK